MEPRRRFPTRIVLGSAHRCHRSGCRRCRPRSREYAVGWHRYRRRRDRDQPRAFRADRPRAPGWCLTSSGEVLTNNHVIRGATEIRVKVPGTGRSYPAEVVGYSVSDDVAVIQASGVSNLKTASRGDSAAVDVGKVAVVRP